MTYDDTTASAGRPLWHGRFAAAPAEELLAFTRSLPFDMRLWQDDIDGTTGHVEMLGAVGLLDEAETNAILGALRTVAAEFREGLLAGGGAPIDDVEDVHTLLEHRVTALVGEVGAKMHTGRSRNDQVATALRLWCRREVRGVAASLLAMIDALADRADEADSHQPPLAVASYTHLQRAQVVVFSHSLRAHAWGLLRDVDRLSDALRRADVSPLGAGAAGGSTLPLDPEATARHLGFGSVFDNSLDAVSDRDFVAEILFALAMCGVHLSRIGEEIVLWSSAEFGWVVLDDAHSTGSSMLPQKKNADIAELARGKAGRLVGNLMSVLTMLKGLPMSYNRDLQEDKEPLFDSVDTIRLAASALRGMLSTLEFVPERMAASTSSAEIHAVDLAEHLVRQGVPFRRAHEIVGEAVARAIRDGISFEDAVATSPDFDGLDGDFFEVTVALGRRTSRGGGGYEAAVRQRTELRSRITASRDRLGVAD